MGRRIKLKTPRLKVVSRNEIHDRRASNLTHRDVAPINVADPYEAGATITVMRSLRDDPLGAMHAGKHLFIVDEKDGEQLANCRYLAGRRWQKSYELAEIGGARAIDYTQDKVDGGQIAQPTVSDVQARAMADMRKATKALQVYDASIVFDVLARNMTITQIAAARSITNWRQICNMMDRFRGALDILAKSFGLTT